MLSQLVFVSRILTLLAVGFSKCSVILFLRQLFAGTADKGWNICNIFLLATGIWTVASALVVSAGCPPSGALLLESSSQCSGDVSEHTEFPELPQLTSSPAHTMEIGDRTGCLP